MNETAIELACEMLRAGYHSWEITYILSAEIGHGISGPVELNMILREARRRCDVSIGEVVP